jgi:uncharacterized membrane protein YtjA (UPF0391 family)
LWRLKSGVWNENRPTNGDRDNGADKGRHEDERDATANCAGTRLFGRAIFFHDQTICTLRGLAERTPPFVRGCRHVAGFLPHRLATLLSGQKGGTEGQEPRYLSAKRRLIFIRRSRPMLHWALVFLVVALVAAVFGFGGIASTAAGMAQILFVVALVLFVVSLLFGFARGRNNL